MLGNDAENNNHECPTCKRRFHTEKGKNHHRAKSSKCKKAWLKEKKEPIICPNAHCAAKLANKNYLIKHLIYHCHDTFEEEDNSDFEIIKDGKINRSRMYGFGTPIDDKDYIHE